MHGRRGPDDLAGAFRKFAVGARRDGAPRYARICEGAASDPDLVELVALAPPDQRRPNILLAAVHHLLLTGVDDALADYYPTVLAWRGIDLVDPMAAGDPFPPFAAFCARHREAVAELVATRATQTNEVGRCTAILPALSTIASSRDGSPIALVDVGAAAGLNLLFDLYAYDYAGAGTAGVAGSPVVLHCELRDGTVDDDRGDPPRPPTTLPRVAARVGLDRHPVDVRDDDQALWLLACQWPDHPDRFDTARRALSLARSVAEPPVVRSGDAVEDLASVVDMLPDDAHVCVLHSWVAAYFTPEQQRALGDVVARVASTRAVSWLFAETPYEVPALPVPPPAEERIRGATAVVLVEQAPGSRRVVRRLADMHSHGRWLRWYGTGR
ncbi:MAG: DUF2332 domain-containing protein [Acidimicrobiales bacterium]